MCFLLRQLMVGVAGRFVLRRVGSDDSAYDVVINEAEDDEDGAKASVCRIVARHNNMQMKER